MRIPIKLNKIVMVETSIDYIDYIEVPINSKIQDSHFQSLIDYLLSITFIGSTTSFNSFRNFVSYEQGGDNTVSLEGISLIRCTGGKLAIMVNWVDDEYDCGGEVVLFNKNKNL